MKRPLLLVVLLGCHGPSGRTEGGIQLWTGAEKGFESPAPWHQDQKSGLAVRLLAKNAPVLGKPILVTLEARNFGDRTVAFDAQGLGFVPFRLRGPGDREMPLVDRSGHRGQTMQHYIFLEPDDSRTLDQVDLTHSFAIFGPGEYRVQFTGLWKWDMEPDELPAGAPPGSVVAAVPESAPLRMDILPGVVSLRDRMIERLLPALPKKWVLYDEGGERGSILEFRGPDLDRFGRAATIRVGFGTATMENRALGRSSLGDLWIGPVHVSRMNPRDAEDERWEKDLSQTFVPGLEEEIKKAFGIGRTQPF